MSESASVHEEAPAEKSGDVVNAEVEKGAPAPVEK